MKTEGFCEKMSSKTTGEDREEMQVQVTATSLLLVVMSRAELTQFTAQHGAVKLQAVAKLAVKNLIGLIGMW